MGIWNSKRPDGPKPETEQPDRLREIAAQKVEAAERLSASLAEAGTAFEALFAADRAYLAEYRQRYGSEAFSGSLLMNRFRWMLLCELELSAPNLLKYLDQPRQSLARCHTIATNITRQVYNDLSSLPADKELAQ